MRRLRRCLGLALLVGVAFGLSSCGGGGKGASSSVAPDCSNQAGLITSFPTPTGANFVAVTIDGGPVVSGASIGTINQSYVTVQVCVPGTTTCQTIDHVWVDTGSVGLRLFSSGLTVSLPAETQGLNVLASCAQFVATYAWGAVRTADILVGGEKATSVPIQVIGDTAVPAVANAPSGCSSGTGGALTAYGTPSDMGANGLLGIGVFLQDCGPGCAGVPAPPHFYYTCTGTTGATCSPATVPTNMQVQNPVGLFPTDNNGSLLQLPSVPPQGQATGSGYLIFGINTQSNNQLGSALVFPADPNFGFINTTKTYGSTSNVSSFVDSGSNAWFFDDPTLTVCPNNKDFFCSTVMLSATMSAYQGFTGTASSHTYGFCIENLNSAFLTGTWAFNDVGGPGMAGSFDWGLPFFYGRSVFTAIESATIPPTPINGNPPPFFAASTP